MPAAAGIFIRPVDPQHVARALGAFCPGAATQTAAVRESFSVLQRGERIQEAIALMAEEPTPATVVSDAARSVAVAHAIDMNESIVRAADDRQLPKREESSVFAPNVERAPVELGA